MTELQFLIDLLLNHKLNAGTKKIIADRIGQVEISLRDGKQNVPRGTNPLIAMQAPSTQALLERNGPPIPTHIVSAPLPVAAPSTNRIIGGEVSTGAGTKGPRKF